MTRQPETSAASAIPGEAVAGAADAHCTVGRHGTAAAYRRGCRCEIARRAVGRYEKQRQLDIIRGQSRTLSNVGAVRRLNALRALGYTGRDLAARIGVDERNMCRWPHRATISRAHHDAVCRVYDELADTPGSDERARRHAARQGWLPPIWWDDDTLDGDFYKDTVAAKDDYIQTAVVDDVAIDRYLAGDSTVPLHRDEKRAAFTRLLTAGWAPNTAGKFLGINGVYVRRYVLEAGPTVGSRRDDAPMIGQRDHSVDFGPPWTSSLDESGIIAGKPTHRPGAGRRDWVLYDPRGNVLDRADI